MEYEPIDSVLEKDTDEQTKTLEALFLAITKSPEKGEERKMLIGLVLEVILQ